MTPTTCQGCGSNQGSYHRAREMMFGTREEFTYFECGGCGALHLADPPADPGKYYPKGYYSFDPGAVPPRAGRLARLRNRLAIFGPGRVGRLLARRPDLGYFRELFATAPVRDFGCRVLDVGCGGGEFLLRLRALGFESLTGIEPYADPPAGLPVRVTRTHLADFAGGPFDVVYCNHVLEHMPDQRAALRDMRRLLAPGGVVLVGIPVAGSELWREYGTDWVELDAPRHLFVHSRASFRRTAADAGLAVDRVTDTEEGFGYRGSELYRRGLPLTGTDPAAVFTPAELAGFKVRAAAACARGDAGRALFYLRTGG